MGFACTMFAGVIVVQHVGHLGGHINSPLFWVACYLDQDTWPTSSPESFCLLLLYPHRIPGTTDTCAVHMVFMQVHRRVEARFSYLCIKCFYPQKHPPNLVKIYKPTNLVISIISEVGKVALNITHKN